MLPLRFVEPVAPVSRPSSCQLSAFVFSDNYYYNTAARRQIGATINASPSLARDLLDAYSFDVAFIVLPDDQQPSHVRFQLVPYALRRRVRAVCLVHNDNPYVDEWLWGKQAPNCTQLLQPIRLTRENTQLVCAAGGFMSIPNWAKLADWVARLPA